MLHFGICALLLISTVSAIPAPSGRVLSAVIHNNQNIPVRCTVNWEGPNGPLAEKDVVTIDSNQEKTINERDIDFGDWYAFATIKRIQCGDSILLHPFEGVSSLTTFWNFAIESNGLVSVVPKPE